MIRKLVTIGVYGFTESQFFSAIQDAGVGLFCDVRARRGVRGKEYAFANAKRLERRLQEMGVCYVHRKDLAPSESTRTRQYTFDRQAGIGKRERTRLAAEFVRAYEHERLSRFDSVEFVRTLGDAAAVVALCCVESDPRACHRSLVADRLAADLEIECEHLVP
jgi:uncharacterized protein (DUF488 family)